jgi:hypothetical protein
VFGFGNGVTSTTPPQYLSFSIQHKQNLLEKQASFVFEIRPTASPAWFAMFALLGL